MNHSMRLKKIIPRFFVTLDRLEATVSPTHVAGVIYSLVLFALIVGWQPRSALASNTIVYPTGSFPLDVQNVQDVINRGDTVILKATNIAGQLTAFNFGPAETHNGNRANLTTNVTIFGERVGQSMTTINGGFAPFLSFAPVKMHIEGIDFEGAMDSPIVIVGSSGAEIVGNVIRNLVPVPIIFPFQGGEIEGIFVAGNDDPQNAITGRITIADNLIEISTGDFANGMQFDEVAADIEITGNTVTFLQSNGIILTSGITVFRSHGHANIVDNTVTIGPGAADIFPVGIFVGGHAEAHYKIMGNTVITSNPSADGMDVVGLEASEITHAAMITNNHIVMQSLVPTSGGIALAGAVDNSIVAANKIEGTNGNAIQILGFDFDRSTVAHSNRALGNDISKDSALVSDIHFGPLSTNNFVAGQCASYIDEGVGNRISCGTPVNPLAAAARTDAGASNQFDWLKRDDIRSRINAIHDVRSGRNESGANRSGELCWQPQ
jgi:hypothetical protein